MLGRCLAAAALLLGGYDAAQAAPPEGKPPQMIVLKGQDASGSVYKKLGLPNQQYCWDACLKEGKCTGVRWGVIEGDTAGLCMLISGPLSFKALSTPKTEDGKKIRVIAAKKQVNAADHGV